MRFAARPIPTLLLVALGAMTLVSCTTPVSVDDRMRGDADLIDEIAATYAEEHERAAVAVVDGSEVRTAFVDADETSHFEIGSITKGLTGELLAIATERGEVTPDDRLGDHLDLGDAPVASVTLLQLATHRAGLPEFTDDADWNAAFDRSLAARENPFEEEELGQLLAIAGNVTLTPDAGFEYSNLGAALLGHALASAAGVEFPELLQERLLDPIGMDAAALVETPEQVPETHTGGFTVQGDPVEPWALGPFSPAGGVHATLGDLVALARAMLDGDLADSVALEPVVDAWDRDSAIGYFWFVEDRRPRTLTGLGGLTAGFGSALMIDRDAGTASIVLTNTGSDPYELALRLLIAADR